MVIGPRVFIYCLLGQSVVFEALVTLFQERTFVFELYLYCYIFLQEFRIIFQANKYSKLSLM